MPRVDVVGKDGSLYYSDVLIDPILPSVSNAKAIYKMDGNGTVSTVYSVADPILNWITSFDVAGDGALYVSEKNRVYRVELNGSVSRIAGTDGIIAATWPFQVLNGPSQGTNAIDSYYGTIAAFFDGINEIKVAPDNSFVLTSNIMGGAGLQSVWVNSSGINISDPYVSASNWPNYYYGRLDFCPNSSIVTRSNSSGSPLSLIDRNGGVNVLASGLTSFSSLSVSDDGDDIFFVDPNTSSIMKLIGSPN